MKLAAFLFGCILATAPTVAAQIELVSGDYFPANQEFQDLQKVISEETFDDPARLSKVDDGGLLSDVGFQKYAKRVYSIANSDPLTVEILMLLDYRAAYSMLTLLRDGSIRNGPPGDYYTATTDGLHFAQGKQWVRIRGRNTPEDLARRVAISISNRIGSRRLKPPSLVSHLPGHGYDPLSLRYYPGVKAFESYSAKVGGTALQLSADMEIAQARYSLDGRNGTLSLLSFPTSEMAEAYYDTLSDLETVEKAGSRTYAKRAGPIVGLLQGPFEPASANKLLNAIKFSYSIQWVYEKDNKPQKVIWGIPVGILGTVVRSLFFVVLLGGISIIVGIIVAAIRFMRAANRSLDEQERNEITRLRM
jgi:hypothetical protein